MADVLTPIALRVVAVVDKHLDEGASDSYQAQPLAKDWARVAKTVEEAGEAVEALIAWTGQNPRKGVCGTEDELLAELADVTFTAILAIQHFTKDHARTAEVLAASLDKLISRVPAAS